MKTVAQRAGAAIAEIRFALKDATPQERESILATLRGMVGEAPAAKVPELRDYMASADEIVAAAQRVLANGGGFGQEKAFISEVHAELKTSEPLGAFKARLVEMNRRDDLSISRADLVEAMDPAKVAASEKTHDLGFGSVTTWHFVRVR